MKRLLEVSKVPMPTDEELDKLAAVEEREELDEGEFKRGEWSPVVDEKVRVRDTPEQEMDIDDHEIPVGSTGKILNHLVAYRIDFGDDVGIRWVTKAMIEPV